MEKHDISIPPDESMEVTSNEALHFEEYEHRHLEEDVYKSEQHNEDNQNLDSLALNEE
jgi:hypothetical protein